LKLRGSTGWAMSVFSRKKSKWPAFPPAAGGE
jgi:hypothetical protein